MSRNDVKTKEHSLTQMDDFKVIHGIGPGIESRLHAAGIRTYAQLASLTPDQAATFLSGLVGMTSKRVSDQDWIGQASKLTPGELMEYPDDEAVRQHYATYTVELLLDEDNGVRRTRTMHIQSKVEETWAGWDRHRLVDFFIQHADLKIFEQPESPSPTGILSERGSIKHEAVIENPRLSGNPQLGELHTISLQTGHHGRILPRYQPFEVDVNLDLAKLVIPQAKTVGYDAQFFVKALGDGGRQKIGEVQGAFTAAESVDMMINNTGLHEGTYRISLDLILSLSPANPASQPELVISMDGGLLHVY